jgi:tetratricopeptide (TPR) repeat protein
VAGNPEVAQAGYEEALAIQRRIGDFEGAGGSLGGIAQIAAMAGDLEKAVALFREAFGAYDVVGDRAEQARVLDGLAWSTLALGRTDEARDRFVESLRVYEEVGSVRGVGIALAGLAATEAVRGEAARAVCLAAAAAVFSEWEGIVKFWGEGNPGLQYIQTARGFPACRRGGAAD